MGFHAFPFHDVRRASKTQGNSFLECPIGQFAPMLEVRIRAGLIEEPLILLMFQAPLFVSSFLCPLLGNQRADFFEALLQKFLPVGRRP